MPGSSKLCDGAVAQIARTFRGAAGEQHDVASGEPVGDEALQHALLVGADAEGDRHSARLGDRGGEDRGVRIVNPAGPDRLSRRHDLVAGRDDRDQRPAPHLDRGEPDRRQHADLARGQHLAGAQHRLAAGEVAAGKGDELAGDRRAAHRDCRNAAFAVAIAVDGLGVLDHDHRVGAARRHAAGGDQGRGARLDGEVGCHAGGQDFRVQREDFGRSLAGADGVVGAHGKAVDTGAVEPRRVDFGDDRARQHPAQCLRQRHGLAAERLQPQMAVKPRHRLVAADDVEKLLLPRQAAQRRPDVVHRRRTVAGARIAVAGFFTIRARRGSA